MSTPGLDKLIARVGGLDPNRPLIHFAHESLRTWAKRRPTGAAGNVDAKTVVLWPDSFNSSLGTSPATAAVEVLEALGYRVEIPQEFVCCGLTWHSTGQLGMTQRVLAQTAKVMAPYLDRGLRSEAVELAPPADAGEVQVGDNPAVSALTQVHCHEKSLGDPSHAAAIVKALGMTEEQIATGCCGLAGNWGFEKGHAEVSMALGERELFPKVREAIASGDDAVVIADGFSCRTQIEQGTGAQAKHIAEIVRDILVADDWSQGTSPAGPRGVGGWR